jgi:hypothetical protein
MRTPLRLSAALALAGVALGACGDDDESAATTTSFQIGTPATVDAPASTVSPQTAVTIGPVTAETTDIPITPTGTADIPVVSPVDSTDTPVIIAVFVGTETGPDRIETVPLGSAISVSIVNGTAADEYHIHGYDLGDGQEFAAGETATFSFTADTAGDFEVESHATDSVLFILRVA